VEQQVAGGVNGKLAYAVEPVLIERYRLPVRRQCRIGEHSTFNLRHDPQEQAPALAPAQ
jgi:hypothetical protein